MTYFTEDQLRGYARSTELKKEARAHTKTLPSLANVRIFLSHSHKDRELAEGVANLLASQGCEVYIDWKDTTMPKVTNRETAERIRLRIRQDDFFVCLATKNAMDSKWVPWELGIADDSQGFDNILIIPVKDPYGRFHGNEYVQVYRRLDTDLNVLKPEDQYYFQGVKLASFMRARANV
ncbi:MAG: toll/interleukin-1 receptor domain-containing protein [Bacteroidota bacterium]